MKATCIKLLLLFFVSQVAISQTIITGTVKDESGMPLSGANVIIENTSRGGTADFDGNYSIEAQKGEVLLISFVGFITLKQTIDDRTSYDVVLKEDSAKLDEVVVVGYGQQKKINLTSSIATVNFKEEVNQPVTNSGQLLYGRFSGVQLTQTSGNPGADGSSIVIRGIGTFGGTTPLVVIDNIQYDDLNAFNNLAPSDIESITVLKDASASAIYGARGANGVVLVTTRKGKKDSFEVSYNGFYGVQDVTVRPDFLNASNYSLLMNEKFRNENGPAFIPRYTDEQIAAINNGSLPDQFADTDWADLVLQQATIQNHNMSFSGGSKNTSYRISLGYMGQNSIIKSKFISDRTNLSVNINSKLKEWLSISSVTNTFWRHNEGPTGGQDAFSGDNGIIYSFQRAAPTIPAFYSNGEYGIVDGAYLNDNPSLSTQNPLRRGFLGDFNSDNINISHITGLTINFTKDLSFETRGSANVIYSNSSDFSPRTVTNDWAGIEIASGDLNRLSNGTGFEYKLLNENLVRYKKEFNENQNFGAVIGHSASYLRNDGFSGRLAGFPTDNIQEFDGGGVIEPSVSGSAYEESYQSFFGRFNYDFDGKYLAEFTIRRDGSSKFGSEYSYGTFPAASVGWRVSKEKFMEDLKIINDLKFRASWGISGNDRIGNYIFEQTYNPGIDYVLGDNSTVVGVAVTTLANPFIRWEETQQYDLGLDLAMFDNKLDIILDYFNRNSSDILYTNFPVPNTLGVTSLAAQNAASMINTGLEFGANWRGKIGDAKYSVGTNLTKFLKNEVTGLGPGGEETITGTNIIRIGEAFRSFYGYQAIGIFQSVEEVVNSPTQFGNNNTNAGDIKYADISGPDGVPDGIVDADDRMVIGNPNPDLLINFNASFEYMGFDVSALFQGVYGIDRLFMGNGNLPFPDDRSNALEYWINRWTPDNPNGGLPRVGGQNNTAVSTFYIQDASYLRLKNFEIGYSLPKKLLNEFKISKLRIFMGAQNYLTFTGLENFDPEGGTGSQSNRNAPLYKTITFGLNVKL